MTYFPPPNSGFGFGFRVGVVFSVGVDVCVGVGVVVGVDVGVDVGVLVFNRRLPSHPFRPNSLFLDQPRSSSFIRLDI